MHWVGVPLVPHVLLGTAQVAHEVVDEVAAVALRAVQRQHRPKHRRHLRPSTTRVARVPRAVDQVALGS